MDVPLTEHVSTFLIDDDEELEGVNNEIRDESPTSDCIDYDTMTTKVKYLRCEIKFEAK